MKLIKRTGACYREKKKTKLFSRSLDEVGRKQTFEGKCEAARILFHLLITGFMRSILGRMHGQGQGHL